MRWPPRTIEENFNSKWVIEDNGCHKWTSKGNQQGRGQFRINGKQISAPRVSWFIDKGEWPPEHLYVCHHCDNPSCVNVDHLFLGTQKENMQDCSRKNRFRDRTGENNARARLSKIDVNIIRSLKASGMKGMDISKEFNVSPSCVYLILNGKHWKSDDSTMAANWNGRKTKLFTHDV